MAIDTYIDMDVDMEDAEAEIADTFLGHRKH